VPQNIKDRLRARGFNADIYPMSFYQELGDRIIAKARSTTASRIGQMEICVELAEEAAILIMGQHRP
jgi:hypothetical protein